jgi:hypothetical protein
MSTPQTDIITYEQFLEEMRQVANMFTVTEIPFLALYRGITGYQWERRSSELLTKERTEHFVNAMSEKLYDLVCCGAQLKDQARNYLLAVQETCIRLSVDITGINFKPPLCARDITISRDDVAEVEESMLRSCT